MIKFLYLILVLAWHLHAPGVANWGTVDGHRHCMAIIADTSVVVCADGYVTTS